MILAYSGISRHNTDMTSLNLITDIFSAVESSLSDKSFVKLSLGKYSGDEQGLKAIDIRKVIIKREDKLSFTFHYKTRDIVKNYGVDESLTRIKVFLTDNFQSAKLFTTDFDMILDKNKIRKTPPSHSGPISSDHDRKKERHISPEGKQYLHALNITDEKGAVFKNAQDKFRQINKYIEILSGLINQIPKGSIKKIIDMGSGKGYLTFALADYLQELEMGTKIVGVEMREDMVTLCNRIASHSKLTNLSFTQASIQNYDATGANILIALHACDTATDDAIYKGITAGAELIVVAPCCHKQIRREIEESESNPELGFLLRHGIFMERQAEMVTDGLRSLILESCGYSTKVFEFISDAHTPKNVMIVATKNKKSQVNDPVILQKIRNAKSYYGVKAHYLENLLGM
jgi:hypothetical protein